MLFSIAVILLPLVAMNWIVISNQLPEIGLPVLLYNANAGTVGLAQYQVSALSDQNGVLKWVIESDALQSLNTYTHWLPLPEPPNDEHFEAIKFVADSVLSHHLPADGKLREFSFKITVEGRTYEVAYAKDTDGYWEFKSYA